MTHGMCWRIQVVVCSFFHQYCCIPSVALRKGRKKDCRSSKLTAWLCAQRRKKKKTPDHHAINYDGVKVIDNFKNRTVLCPHSFSVLNLQPEAPSGRNRFWLNYYPIDFGSSAELGLNTFQTIPLSNRAGPKILHTQSLTFQHVKRICFGFSTRL